MTYLRKSHILFHQPQKCWQNKFLSNILGIFSPRLSRHWLDLLSAFVSRRIYIGAAISWHKEPASRSWGQKEDGELTVYWFRLWRRKKWVDLKFWGWNIKHLPLPKGSISSSSSATLVFERSNIKKKWNPSNVALSNNSLPTMTLWHSLSMPKLGTVVTFISLHDSQPSYSNKLQEHIISCLEISTSFPSQHPTKNINNMLEQQQHSEVANPQRIFLPSLFGALLETCLHCARTVELLERKAIREKRPRQILTFIVGTVWNINSSTQTTGKILKR